MYLRKSSQVKQQMKQVYNRLKTTIPDSSVPSDKSIKTMIFIETCKWLKQKNYHTEISTLTITAECKNSQYTYSLDCSNFLAASFFSFSFSRYSSSSFPSNLTRFLNCR